MIKTWLTFSKGERYGLVVLFILIFIVAVFPYLHQILFPISFEDDNLAQQNKVDSFFQSLEYRSSQTYSPFSLADEETPRKPEAEVFPFDPNTVSIAELLRLGFSEKQAMTIEKYREKGWKFRTADDFGKVYVVDSSLFKKLKPYISIPPSDHPWQRQAAITDSLKKVRENIIVELNTADTLELVKLKGIGRGYARRIAAHRTLLGGFMNIEQLTDIYGITPELVESIRPQVRIDTMLTKRIYLNMISYNELKMHPYLTDYQARAIIYHREKVGNVDNMSTLVDKKLLDPKTFEKIKRYIVLN
jgi:DNA uptake protein ComE-like DNA-binding protein